MPDIKNPETSDLSQIKDVVTDKADSEIQPKPSIKIGETVSLQAVHSDLEHPFVKGLTFVVGATKKVVVDAWIKVQYDGDKLKTED